MTPQKKKPTCASHLFLVQKVVQRFISIWHRLRIQLRDVVLQAMDFRGCVENEKMRNPFFGAKRKQKKKKKDECALKGRKAKARTSLRVFNTPTNQEPCQIPPVSSVHLYGSRFTGRRTCNPPQKAALCT